LSYSRLSEWLKCRYRWELRYERKITQRVNDRAPQLGSAIHVGLAAALNEHAKQRGVVGVAYAASCSAIEAWRAEWYTRDMFDEEYEQVEEVATTATIIAARTLDDFHLPQWEVLQHRGVPLVEKQLKVRLPGWAGFQVYFDLVARDLNTGHVWLIDWKTRKQFLPVEAEEVNLQMGIYQEVARRLGIPAVGSIAYQIRSKVPATPTLNKNGTMSRSQITTDWPTYRQALVDNGLDPEDYREEMSAKLTTPFFSRATAYRTDEETRALWEEVVVPASHEMRYTRRHFLRNLYALNCQTCWARPWCLEEMRGQDPSWLLNSQLQQVAAAVDADTPIDTDEPI